LSQFQNLTILYIVPFGEIQDEIIEKIEPGNRMLVYRKFMTQLAANISYSENASFLVTGDSMNQVASQTFKNLQAIYMTSKRPVICPLIGMDKHEIMKIANQIGTEELSNLPYGDCCSYFVAKHPNLHLHSARNKNEGLDVIQSIPNFF